MKTTIKSLILLSLLSAGTLLHAGSLTVGTYDNANCYPFTCNDSGTNMGVTMDYQQVYASSQFTSPPNKYDINSISFNLAAFFEGNNLLLGGTYTLEWGYAVSGSLNNLSTNLASNYNYILGGPNLIRSFTVPAGGFNFGSSLTFPLNGYQFAYNPKLGNLLLEIIATGQTNVPNGSGNSYLEGDDTGSVTSRAYCIGNGGGCFADSFGLVTTFDYAAPTPDSLVLTCTGLLTLAGAFRWKKLI